MTDWRPISTAPREPYKKLDLWVVPGRHYNQKHRAKPYRVADAYASGNGKYWLDAEGRGLDATIVTHWQPIPEGPE
jgi:hypothetical protein